MRLLSFWVVGLLALARVSAAQAQSCGVLPQNIGKLFADGFEFGEVRPILPAAGTAHALTLDAPANGSTVGTDTVQIYGGFAGPPNTGVSLNGVAAATLIDGAGGAQRFLASKVLQPGSNTLNLVLTSESGATQTLTRTITYDPNLAPSATLTAAFTNDYAKMQVAFRPIAKAGKRIQSISLDYTSDGTIDQAGTIATNFVGTYNNPGLYVATANITVTDVGGANQQVINTSFRVLAENKQVVRYTLCGVYDRAVAALQAQQVNTAASFLTSDIRPRFQTLWNNNLAQLPTIATQLGSIVTGVIGTDIAAYTLHRGDGVNRVKAYALQFSKSPTGVWRISNW